MSRPPTCECWSPEWGPPEHPDVCRSCGGWLPELAEGSFLRARYDLTFAVEGLRAAIIAETHPRLRRLVRWITRGRK